MRLRLTAAAAAVPSILGVLLPLALLRQKLPHKTAVLLPKALAA
jgi:hypothetical protein